MIQQSPLLRHCTAWRDARYGNDYCCSLPITIKLTTAKLLRDLLLDFRQQHTNLVDHCLKPVFVKHFCSRMNPINVTLNIYSKSSAFQAKHLKDPNQQLLGDVDAKQLAWKRAPIKSYFGSSSKAAPCLQINDKVFWNSIDNHNHSCERYIGLK